MKNDTADKRTRQLAALDALRRMRLQVQAEHGELPGDWLEQIREEHERDQERVLRGEP